MKILFITVAFEVMLLSIGFLLAFTPISFINVLFWFIFFRVVWYIINEEYKKRKLIEEITKDYEEWIK